MVSPREARWDLDVTADTGLEGLPLYVYREAGEQHALPCAEVLMSEATIGRVAEEGCVVLGSLRDRDEARFYGVQTLGGTGLRVRRPG